MFVSLIDAFLLGKWLCWVDQVMEISKYEWELSSLQHSVFKHRESTREGVFSAFKFMKEKLVVI